MRKLFIIITFLILLAKPLTVYAQEGFSGLGFDIDPSITEMDLDPGDKVNVRTRISKKYQEPIPMSLYISPYYPEGSEGREFSDLPDCMDWLTLEEDALILEEDEKRTVKVTVRVPNDAIPGSYFATVVFAPVIPESYFLEQSAHIYPHIGALLVINVNGERFSENVKLESFEYTAETEDPSYFTSALVNDDQYYSTVKGEILVQDLFGNIKDSLQVDETKVLPGERRTLTNELTSELPFGFYKAKFQLVKHDELVTETISFISIKTPTTTLLVILAILVVFAYSLTKYILDISKKTNYPKFSS